MHHICCMIKRENTVKKLLKKLLKKRLKHKTVLNSKLEKRLEQSVKCIVCYAAKFKKGDYYENVIKVFGNYNLLNIYLRSTINSPVDNPDQKHMTLDHVPSVKMSSKEVFDRALNKKITLKNMNNKIDDLYSLIIGIKLTRIQHKILNNDDYTLMEQMNLLHYKDLNTVLSFIKFRKKEIEEELDKDNHPLVYHKKSHSPEIVFVKKSRYGETIKKISEENKDQNDIIFYKKIFDEPAKYISRCEVIQFEPSNAKWGSCQGVKELIGELNKNIRPADQHNNNLINNKKEEGAPLLVVI